MNWYEAIVTAFSGGAVAAVGTGFFALRGKHTEQLREQMLSAADEFITGAQQARDRLYVIYRDSDQVSAGSDIDEYTRLVREANARLARVLLLYGPETPASEDAEETVSHLDYARKFNAVALTNLLHDDADEDAIAAGREKVFTDIDHVDEHIRDFAAAAWTAMKRPTRRKG